MVRLRLFSIVLLIASPFSLLYAQKDAGSWSFGIRGGASLWDSKYDQKKIGAGADVMLRFRTAGRLTLAFQAGLEELKSGLSTPKISDVYPITYDYLKFLSFPAAATLSYAFTDNPVSPYMSVGIGATMYQRRANLNEYVPSNKFRYSFVIPVAIGVEAFTGRQTSFVAEVGAHIADSRLDIQRSGNPLIAFTARAGFNFYFGNRDNDDDDGDGLSNVEERRLGTNPLYPDTDHDGLTDGQEVKTYKTNPLKTDTDGDGLSDGEEVLKYHTDPLKSDTDGDGLSDGDEILKYHTDPLKADTDGDGLSDGEEVLIYHTEPLQVDTDGDGLSDWEEVKIYHTDPLKKDTDGDGLSDFEEVRKYKTDPLKADTDGGGVPDGQEVRRGTNPLDPRDDMPTPTMRLEKGKSMVMEGVNFESGTARLSASSEATLARVLQALRDNPDAVIEIAGYTDNLGKASANLGLSRRRAEIVKTWLVDHGISALRLTAQGFGSKDPIAPNTTVLGRSQNRRIEFHIK